MTTHQSNAISYTSKDIHRHCKSLPSFRLFIGGGSLQSDFKYLRQHLKYIQPAAENILSSNMCFTHIHTFYSLAQLNKNIDKLFSLIQLQHNKSKNYHVDYKFRYLCIYVTAKKAELSRAFPERIEICQNV